jgi:hypothetical protein
MDKTTPTLEQWRRLYQATMQVKELAPWEWMTETDVFGVQDPETKEIGFASVMGALGEHFSLAVYLGPKGLYGFWAFEDMGPDSLPETLFEIHHLQASFEDRNTLTDQDRALIKELGLKFRGRNAWPMFRSYRPGFYPWYLEAAEARFLTHVLEQAVDVTPRIKEAPEILTPADEDSYLVRVPMKKKEGLVWEDRIVPVPPPEPEPIRLAMDMGLLAEMKRLPQSGASLEVDFFGVPIMIGERGTRPSMPYMLLVVERDSGFVIGSELLQVETTLEAMWGEVSVTLLRQMARMGIVPRQIGVRSPLLLQLLQPLGEELKFKIRLITAMRSLDSAKEFLMQRFV